MFWQASKLHLWDPVSTLGWLELAVLAGCGAECPDRDGDGFGGSECGGPDCDDTHGTVHPHAPDNEQIGTWVSEVVDQGAGGSLALDSAGDLHVSYGVDGLRYATRTQQGWEIETVNADPWVWHTSLALDDLGTPQVAYTNFDDVRFARREADGWTVDVVDSGVSAVSMVSLALCADGSAHIAYRRAYRGRLATNRTGTWVIEDIGQDEVGSDNVSVGADEDCVLHVSYQGGEHDWEHDLRYATKRLGFWSVETVHEFHAEETSALAIDSAGSVRIAYVDRDEMLYAAQTADGWRLETVAPFELVHGHDPVLALDDGGAPHLVYFETQICIWGGCESGARLNYATRAEGGWTVEPLGLRFGLFPYPSIRIDADGADHLVYSDESGSGDGSLHYASNRVAADGSDQNCDGVDGVDSDRDGYASIATFGADCDDEDRAVFPAAPDERGDGVDQNCDGADG